MELDSKQIVLISVYGEYQKDIPDYKNGVSSAALGLSQQVIDIALKKLQNEGLIAGFESRTADGRVGYNINFIMLTPAGQNYVENKLLIEPRASGEEKLTAVLSRATDFGWKIISDIAAKTLAEIATKK